MQATIEIDLGRLAEEWEAVAFRLPKKDEIFLIDGKRVERAASDYQYVPQLIVRRKWTWPSWLKARWYAEDANGSQWAYEQMPVRDEVEWHASPPMCRLDEFFDIPRIGGDWKQSMRENPNWKASQE